MESPVEVHSPAGRIARLAWYPAAFAAGIIVLGAASQVLNASPRGVMQIHLVFSDSVWFRGLRSLTFLAVGLSALVSLLLGYIVFRKKGSTRTGLFLAFYLLAFGVLMAGPIELLEPIWPSAPFVNSFILLPIFTGPVTMTLFATFPDGRFVPSWSRWLIPFSAVLLPLSLWSAPDRWPELLESTPVPVLAGLFLLSVGTYVGAIYVQAHRYRVVSTQAQRRQTKWVLYGIVLWLTLMVVSSLSWMGAMRLAPGSPAPWWLPLGELVWVSSTLFFPLSLAVAILRHQLFDIDWIINRTLVYGALTIGVLVLYAMLVMAAGVVMQTNSRLAGLILSAAIVAVSFRPLKSAVQDWADRILPGSPGAPADTAADFAPALPIPYTSPESGEGTLSSPSHRLARGLWYPAAAVGLLLFITSLPGHVLQLTVLPHSGATTVQPGSLQYLLNIVSASLATFSAGLSLGLAVLLFRRRADDGMALFLSYYLLAHGLIIAGPIEALEPFVHGIADFSIAVLSPAVLGPMSMALLALFPDGRFVPRWTRWIVYGSVVFIPMSVVVGNPDMRDPVISTFVIISYMVFFGAGFVMIYAQIYRHRNAADALQRLQTKWFVYGFGLWLAFTALSSIPYIWIDSQPAGTPIPAWMPAFTALWWLATAILPVSLTVAVMRYRLYDIDLLINRTLVYGALTTSVVAVYAVVVGGLGVLFQSSGNLVVSLLATGLVAVLFQPLRERLQSGVNRLMFGEREDPVSVLSTLSRKLEETISPDEVLQSIVETVALSLKLPYAAVEFEGGHAVQTGASFGRPTSRSTAFPISYQSERIGRLIAAPRSGEDELGQTDRVVLENIARQAGAAAQAARLAADLQQSRMELVAAREEERRRLRRDLHDGLGPQLASQSLTLDALERRLKDDPEGAACLIENLKEQSRSAVRDIRQLVYDLRPPALDELGLVGAIAQLVSGRRHSGLDLKVSNTNEIPPLPAAVEVAAYRIAQEAITNVIRHSGASSCRVEMSYRKRGAGRQLRLEILDNGRGIRPGEWQGVGLHSMRERAEELGGSLEICPADSGGTIVTANLPFPARSP